MLRKIIIDSEQEFDSIAPHLCTCGTIEYADGSPWEIIEDASASIEAGGWIHVIGAEELLPPLQAVLSTIKNVSYKGV